MMSTRDISANFGQCQVAKGHDVEFLVNPAFVYCIRPSRGLCNFSRIIVDLDTLER